MYCIVIFFVILQFIFVKLIAVLSKVHDIELLTRTKADLVRSLSQ